MARAQRMDKALLCLLVAAACASIAAGQEAVAPNAVHPGLANAHPLDPGALLSTPDGAVSAQASTPRLAGLLTKTYLTNDQLAAWTEEFVSGKCGAIARRFSIGKSARGVDMWAIEISDKPGVVEAEPNFKYVANMHGNEPSGRMLLPMLAEWLCANNGKDDRATRLVRDTHIFLVPTMNPDGFALRQRHNGNDVDLNRNFPDAFRNSNWDLRKPLPTSEPETRAMMAFTLSRPFVASANMHEGAVVVNYPFDNYVNPYERSGPHYSPDDAGFKMLSSLYAKKHGHMSQSQEFEGGIVNGADWYFITGGMQDWNYMAAGCMETTLELSQEKFPPPAELPQIWEDNRDALLSYALTASLGGVRGAVTSAAGGPPVQATMFTKPAAGAGNSDVKPVPFYASKEFGFYARALAPGRHTVIATAPGFQSQEVEVTVPADGRGVVQNFVLKPRPAAPGGRRGGARYRAEQKAEAALP